MLSSYLNSLKRNRLRYLWFGYLWFVEDRLYEQIAQEIETNAVDKGIWTKAFAHADGDENRTRAAYIKARFEKLMAAEKVKLEAMQKEEIARHQQEQREEFESTEKFRQRVKLQALSGSDEVKNIAADLPDSEKQ